MNHQPPIRSHESIYRVVELGRNRSKIIFQVNAPGNRICLNKSEMPGQQYTETQ